jgi:hypothetical protein
MRPNLIYWYSTTSSKWMSFHVMLGLVLASATLWTSLYLQETNYCAKSKVTLSATYYITIRAFKNVGILSVDTLQVKRRISQDSPHA